MAPPRARAGCLALLLVAAGCGEREGPPSAVPPTAAPSPVAPTPPAAEREAERLAMVREQIAERGVVDREVLRAMRQVPRHLFVPRDYAREAYDDRPLPIAMGQTISQPYIVASMTEWARIHEGDKVLEVGTGSGYQAAVLAAMGARVFTIEIHAALAEGAGRALERAGARGVAIRCGDGYDGWAEEAPFDAILVTAAADHVPPPLVRQLRPGGRMVIPVGPVYATQALTLVTKDAAGRVATETLYPVRFVPLTRRREAGEDGR